MVGRGDVSNETITGCANRSRDHAQGPPPPIKKVKVLYLWAKWPIEHSRDGESAEPVNKSGRWSSKSGGAHVVGLGDVSSETTTFGSSWSRDNGQGATL